jgi:hypothetical protein
MTAVTPQTSDAAPATDSSAGNSAGGGNTPVTHSTAGSPDAGVEQTRAVTGLLAVIAGDVAIAIAAILGIIYVSRGSSAASTQIAAILSGGFTAIGTMTTAYFGIKSIANTASNIAESSHGPSR